MNALIFIAREEEHLRCRHPEKNDALAVRLGGIHDDVFVRVHALRPGFPGDQEHLRPPERHTRGIRQAHGDFRVNSVRNLDAAAPVALVIHHAAGPEDQGKRGEPDVLKVVFHWIPPGWKRETGKCSSDKRYQPGYPPAPSPGSLSAEAECSAEFSETCRGPY